MEVEMKVKTYSAKGLENVKELIVLLRERSGELSKIEVDSNGLKVAIKKLPHEVKIAVEKFFLGENNLYNKYCIVLGPKDEEILAWRGARPLHVEEIAKKAFSAISILQKPTYLVHYDRAFRELCDGMGVLEGKGLLWLQLYLCFFKGGPLFFFDKEERPDPEKEKKVGIDFCSVISKYHEVLKRRKKPIRLEIVRDWFENALTQEQQKELMLAIGEKPPRNLGVGTPNKLLTFAEAREIKSRLFPKGPWRTAERLVEGYYEPLTGLATLRRLEDYSWHRSVEAEAYTPAGMEVFPGGERLQKYRIKKIKKSIEFFDLEEILWLSRWGPNK